MKPIQSLLLAMAAAVTAVSTHAQTNTFPSSGNVGIGTTSPGAILEIKKPSGGRWQFVNEGADVYTAVNIRNAANTAFQPFLIRSLGFTINDGAADRFSINSNGNVGIGTTNPASKLHVSNDGEVRLILMPNTGANNRESLVDFWSTFDSYPSDVGVRRAARIQAGFDGGVWGTEYMVFGVAGAGDAGLPPTERMRINASGNVGIGTTNPTQKLSVNGTIRAKEVIIEASPWPDDVFEEGYRLKALSEVQEFIAAEGHLPGVPSTATVADQGVAVGEMQRTMMRKIEELTLYVIQLDQSNKQLAGENRRLRADVETLKQSANR